MRNFITLNENGLQIPSTTTEIREVLIEKLKEIYGLDDTPFESNAPDGQVVDIFSQIAYEFYNVLTLNIYNSQFISTAIGNQLDNHAYYRGIKRKGGEFTIQNIEIVVDRTIALTGLDSDYDNLEATAYTVQDNAGQEFLLINSTTLNAGTHTLQFRAKDYGQVLTSPNTLTTPVDVFLGVISVNNPTSQTSVGVEEETDAELRVRCFNANNFQAINSLQSLESAVASLDNVIECKVYDNSTNGTDSQGVPPHSSWVIVDGGNNLDIANTIYKHKGWGGQKGLVSVDITKADGTLKTITFDRPINENLYIKFNLKRSVPNQNPNILAIKDYLVENVKYKTNEPSESARLIIAVVNAINKTGGGLFPLELFISKDGTTWTEYLETVTLQHKFALSPANISITLLI